MKLIVLGISALILTCTSPLLVSQETKAKKGPAAAKASAYPGEKATAKVMTTPSGLKYIDIVVGKGETPKTGEMVEVHYTGYLRNGKKFDSSRDRNEPFTFRLGRRQVIAGWDEGVGTMKVGGKRKLIIPPSLGYGDGGAGNIIPPKAELIFDVELLGVTK